MLVGTVLYGYCGGIFGRDSYADKRVEAVGVDWLVAREIDIDGDVVFAAGKDDIAVLEEYTEKPEDEEDSNENQN